MSRYSRRRRKIASRLGDSEHGKSAYEYEWAAYPDLNRMQRCNAVPEICAKICGQRGGISANKKANNYQAQQGCDFCESKDVLNQRAGFYAKNVNHRERNYQEDRHQILGIDTHIHIAHHNRRSNVNRRNFEQMK